MMAAQENPQFLTICSFSQQCKKTIYMYLLEIPNGKIRKRFSLNFEMADD
jgi:hypothetical protein